MNELVTMVINGLSKKISRILKLASAEIRILVFVFVLSLIVAGMTLSVFGCDGEAVGSPQEIIEKAIAAQSELKSVNLEMNSEMELKSPAESRIVSYSYEGSFERPDKWKLTIQSAGMKSEAVVIGQDVYVKEPGSATWVRKSGDVLGEKSSEDVVDLEYMSSASDVRMVDRKDGKYHLQFNLDVLANAALFNISGITDAERSMLAGKKANMEIWVLKDGLYIERAELSFDSDPSGDEFGGLKVTIITRFSEFNEPVSIEPPI